MMVVWILVVLMEEEVVVLCVEVSEELLEEVLVLPEVL